MMTMTLLDSLASANFAERREFDHGLMKEHFDAYLSMTTDDQAPLAASNYSEFS